MRTPTVSPAAIERRSRVRFGRGNAITIDAEIAAYAGLILLALFLRLVLLSTKPMHHDESQDALFSWLFNGPGVAYDPVLHGPLRFYLMGLSYFLFGASDFTARLAPAFMGTTLVALPYFFRRQLGVLAAFAGAVLFCFSPAYLYFSRFSREDIYVAAITLGLLITVFRFLDRPARWQPALILGLLAASFATKETTYITVFVGGSFFLGLLGWQALQARAAHRPVSQVPLLVSIRSVGFVSWLWGLATFVLVFTLLFTVFFFHPAGLPDGLIRSIQYWLSQQPVQRGGQPWFYYLVLLFSYDWPELVLATVGAVVVWRRPTTLGVFLVWAFLVNLAVYTWAGEKMPWLWLHPLLPLVLLAGLGLQAIWGARGQLVGRLGLSIAAVGALYLLHATTALSYDHPADPREILVFTQTSVDVLTVRDQLLAVDRRVFDATGTHVRIQVDSWDGTAWPWSWYLRDQNGAAYVDMSLPDYRPSGELVVLASPNEQRLRPLLAGYTGYRFKLREWWVPDYSRATTADWARWLMWREPWNPKGSLDEWVYLRNDVLAGASRLSIKPCFKLPGSPVSELPLGLMEASGVSIGFESNRESNTGGRRWTWQENPACRPRHSNSGQPLMDVGRRGAL